MSVRTRKRGKTWSYSFDIEPAPDGKRRMKEKGGFATKEEAFSAGASAYTDWKNGNIGLTSEKVLLKDYLKSWLAVHRKNLKPMTARSYQAAINDISKHLGDIILQELRPRDIDMYLCQLCDEENKARLTLRSRKTILSTALAYAIYPLELLQYNPCTSVKIPKRAVKQVIERYVISSQDLDKLLEKYPFNTDYHIPIVLAYYTGLRVGELLALTWDDVCFETGELSINKQIGYIVGKGRYFDSVKTDSSKRTIILDNTTLSLLQKWKVAQKQNELSAGSQYVCTYLDENNMIIQCSKGSVEHVNLPQIKLICIRVNGKLILKGTLAKALRENGVNCHSFRHTHATRLIESHATPKSVAARLGHKSTAITEDLYTHNTEAMQKQIADITEAMHKNDVGK